MTTKSFRRRRPWTRTVHVTIDGATAGVLLRLDPNDEAWAKIHADAWGEARLVRVDRLERTS